MVQGLQIGGTGRLFDGLRRRFDVKRDGSFASRQNLEGQIPSAGTALIRGTFIQGEHHEAMEICYPGHHPGRHVFSTFSTGLRAGRSGKPTPGGTGVECQVHGSSPRKDDLEALDQHRHEPGYAERPRKLVLAGALGLNVAAEGPRQRRDASVWRPS